MAFKGQDACLDKAEADEPLFTLLARDVSAPRLIERWADIREQRDGLTDQVIEARDCAWAMRAWRVKNRPEIKAP